jgi:hypothetical protein
MQKLLIKIKPTISFDSLLKIGLFPLVLIYSLLPQNIFNAMGPDCIFKSIFEFACFGCGMSRALRELLQFHFGAAMELNPFSPLVLGTVVAIFLSEALIILKKEN